jgi:A/G-specific adenine glycosylase
MLQQTRVAAVIDHYKRFLRMFPTIFALALAPEAEVLACWSGLGYYRRARMLHKAAQFLVAEHAGMLPETSVELRALPGIGDYTSAAIASIAFGESIAVVDGNVERVLLRVIGRPQDTCTAAQNFIREQAAALVPHKRLADRTNAAGDHNQAMMELGATICTPKKPLCECCPVHDLCRTRGEHATVPRAAQKSTPAAYLLVTRKRGVTTEVLLERRKPHASLMPGMIELPHLAMSAVSDREPLLRLRHSITNTNYYVEIYAQQGPEDRALRSTIVHRADAMLWHPVPKLHALPLTGLARKVLQRLDLMSVAGPQNPRRHQLAQAKMPSSDS